VSPDLARRAPDLLHISRRASEGAQLQLLTDSGHDQDIAHAILEEEKAVSSACARSRCSASGMTSCPDRCTPPFALPSLVVNPRNGGPAEGARRGVRYCTSMCQQHVGRLRDVPHRLLGACCRRSSVLSRNGYPRPGPHFLWSVRVRQPHASCLRAPKSRRSILECTFERDACVPMSFALVAPESFRPPGETGADLSCTEKLSWHSLDLKQNTFGSTLVEVLPPCVSFFL
jgi:hypothetical protein